MLTVGKNDAFERIYMEKFRAIASRYGEFVHYEHDRGARDIGLHLTRKFSSGKEQMTSALIWFQMKGKMASTLPIDEYNAQNIVKLSLEVKHLIYWYLQPLPTYLVLYIESADEFLILNISSYVQDNFGHNIMNMDQKTLTIDIPKNAKLDGQVFQIILEKNDLEEWRKVLNVTDEKINYCYRDYDLIWHLSTAKERNVKHNLVFWDWMSKTRSQLKIFEESAESHFILREHWQYMMSIEDLEETYPYAEFFVEESESDWWDDEDEDSTEVILSNGDTLTGVNAANEYIEYKCGMQLNELGEQMVEWISFMTKIGLIEINVGQSEFISIAPWHNRKI